MIKLRRLRLLNGSPVSLETTYIPPRFLPEPGQLEHSLYALWQSRGIVPEDKHFLLKAVSCSDEVAELLNVRAARRCCTSPRPAAMPRVRRWSSAISCVAATFMNSK